MKTFFDLNLSLKVLKGYEKTPDISQLAKQFNTSENKVSSILKLRSQIIEIVDNVEQMPETTTTRVEEPKLKEAEISIIQDTSPLQIVSARSTSTAQARILEDGEVKASQLYKCMFCKKLYLTEEFTLKHIFKVHAISKRALNEFGFEIKATHL